MKSPRHLVKLSALCFWSMAIVSFPVFSQQKDQFPENKSAIRFSLTAAFYTNLEISNTGERHLMSATCPSGNLTVQYYKHIYSDFGILAGAGFGIVPFGFYYEFETPTNSILMNSNSTYNYPVIELSDKVYMQDAFFFPLSVQKSFLKSEAGSFFAEAGIRFNYRYVYPYEIEVGHYYGINDSVSAQLFQLVLTNTMKRNYFSWFFLAGKTFFTKKGNSFHVDVVFHYSPHKTGEGYYKFGHLGYESYGTLKQNINYIGIDFGYSISFSRKAGRNNIQ